MCVLVRKLPAFDGELQKGLPAAFPTTSDFSSDEKAIHLPKRLSFCTARQDGGRRKGKRGSRGTKFAVGGRGLPRHPFGRRRGAGAADVRADVVGPCGRPVDGVFVRRASPASRAHSGRELASA